MPIKSMRAPQNTPQNTADFFEYIQYPCLASPKIDGVRGSIQDRILLSSTLKRLPNNNMQWRYGQPELEGLQGELVVGSAYAPDVYNKTVSVVMSEDKPIDGMIFAVFDHVAADTKHHSLQERLDRAREIVNAYKMPHVVMVPQTLVHNYEELATFEKKMLERGYEGVMLRNPTSPYKEGRATIRERSTFKLKRLEDSEGKVLRFEIGQHNTNAPQTSEEGRTKRSTAAEGLVDSDMIGAIIVDFNGQEVRVAPGKFKHHERRDMLQHPGDYEGRYLKFVHMPHGAKELPRMARAVGWRDPIDMASND